MKYKIVILLIFILSSKVFSQNVKFNIKYSEPLSVFVFLLNLQGNRKNVFKTEFEKSKYNTEKYKNLISKFDNLSFDYSYNFDEYPYVSKIPMQTRDLIRKNLIETNNLNEFKIRSIGLLPNKTIEDLIFIISEFSPVYNELIYLPNKEKFEKQLIDIKEFSEKSNLEELFQKGIIFYNSYWDSTIPFEIAFYPYPNSQGFTASAFNNNFISAIQTDLDNYIDLFSVMMHETYHIIYDEQSLEFKNKIHQYFQENKSNSSNYAELLLNEVLATTLGNGFVFEKLTGKVNDNDWYNQKYINTMALKVYPMTKEYINLKKPIDKNYIDNYIQLFDEHKNWINEYENIMTNRYVLSKNKQDFDSISQLYPYSSYSEYETEISVNSIEKMKKFPLTKIIIISKDDKSKLKLITSEFPELSTWKYNPQKEFVYKKLLKDKSQLIVVNQINSTIESLLKEN